LIRNGTAIPACRNSALPWRSIIRKPTGPRAGRSRLYSTSTALVEVLKRGGDNLTRENVMKVVANTDFEINTYITGIRIKTSPTDFYPIEQVQMRFTGEKWRLFGPIIDGNAE
jgi:branched-chain amino acid transport system substrate-binding protein